MDSITDELQDMLWLGESTPRRRLKGEHLNKLKYSVEKLVRDSVAIKHSPKRKALASIHLGRERYKASTYNTMLTYRIHVERCFQGMIEIGYLRLEKKGYHDPAGNRFLTRYSATSKLLSKFPAKLSKALPVFIPQDRDDNIIRVQETFKKMVKGKEVKLISDEMGTWLFKQHPTMPNLIFMGNFTGIYAMEKKGQEWVYRNKINGFDISSRFFEFSSPAQIIVNHEYKGVFKINLDQDFQQAIEIELDGASCISCNSSLVKFNDNIYYQAKENLYKYILKEEIFEKDSLLNDLNTSIDFKLGKLLNDPTGQLWLFSENNLYYINKTKEEDKAVVKGFALNEKDRKNVSGFEHINLLEGTNYLIGTNRGYLTVDLNTLKEEKFLPKLNSISANDKQKSYTVNLNKDGTLPFQNNNLSFHFTSYDFNRYGKTRFQYLLDGEDQQWSEWKESASVSYANLDYGKYQFKLRSKKGNTISEIVTSPTININPPWHLNSIAICFYAVIIILLLFGYNSFYKRKLKRQRNTLEKKNKRLLEIQELEAQKEIIRLKNEQLQKDIEGKNRELAVATMSTLKRNEFLNTIKAELETIKGEAKAKQLIKSINSKLKNNDDWEYFKKAFDNTDQPLFSKLKETHPSLTKNDLKLCAYLRLNLSSKEIAPLLNISVHSVEIKRYRLRKKMSLERSQGIVEYIMTF